MIVAPPAAGGPPRWVWLVAVPVAALLLATGFGLWRRRRSAPSPAQR